MHRTPVKSSNIRSIGYENGELHIEFFSGKVYCYTGPRVKEHYEELMKADSVGQYFTRRLRQCESTVCTAVSASDPPSSTS